MDRIFASLDSLREALIDLQRNLVSIPALGPDNAGQGEAAKAEYLLGYLRDLGIEDITEINAPDRRVECGFRPNIAAVIPGENQDKTLWIISHMDVVPPGDLSLWESDPFELKVDGDKVIGRGVEDNHQGITSSLMLATALLDQDVTPPVNLGLLFVADEETGSEYGLEYVLSHREDMFAKHDLFLVPDFGTADSTMVEVAEKSMFWLKISVNGKQCHASTPDQGVNTLVASSALVMKLTRLYEIFDKRNPLFDPPFSTFEPTKKEANVPNVNTIPGLDVFYVDCRVLVDYNLEDVLGTIKSMGREVEDEYGVRIEYETVQGGQAAPATDADAQVVKLVIDGVKEVYGVDAEPVGIGGGTVAAFLRRRGYAAAVWATCVHNAHQPNEYCLVSTQLNDAKVMAHMLMQTT